MYSCLWLCHHIHGDFDENNHLGYTPQDTIERVSMMTYIRHGEENTLDLTTHPFFKTQTSTFVFEQPAMSIPGMEISEMGVFSWSPSAEQFNILKAQSMEIPFSARPSDAPDVVIGQIRLIAEGDSVAIDTVNNDIPVETAIIATAVIAEEDSVEETRMDSIELILPTGKMWDQKKEGSAFSFQLQASGGSGSYTYELLAPDYLMSNLDQYGNFTWTPDFEVVPGDKKFQSVPLKLHVFDDARNFLMEEIVITVENVNRPPSISELPTFYIQYNRKNRYNLRASGLVNDPDGDSIIIRPVLEELPQGMKISTAGIIDWKPSVSQFNFLRANPLYLTFTVEDLPYDEKTIGQLKIEISQEDLPPQITLIPNTELIEIEENQELNFNFFISDPNGENDLLRFDFVSGVQEIEESALSNKGQGHYEFSWIPGYDFVKEQGDIEEFILTFFAIDKENNRSQKSVTIRIKDTEDLVEKDRILYDQYRTVLERCWDLIEQLNQKEKELEKSYKKAKNGKKNRAISTASLGALTGLAPVIIQGDGQKVVTGIGGTATATIGTLEASNVLGESPSDIMRNLSYVSQKRNDLIIYGGVFSSKYALPLNRRSNSFQGDLRTLSIHLNLKDVAQLELSASWENPKKATDKNIKKVFKDFNPDQRFKEYYP